MIRKKPISSEEKENQDEVFKVKLSVTIGKKLIESDLDEALFIPTVDKLNPTVVSNMMSEIPALHGRWNFLYNGLSDFRS